MPVDSCSIDTCSTADDDAESLCILGGNNPLVLSVPFKLFSSLGERKASITCTGKKGHVKAKQNIEIDCTYSKKLAWEKNADAKM